MNLTLEELNNKTDEELALIVKETQNDEAFSVLSTRHSSICFNIYNKYRERVIDSGNSFTDLIGDKDFIIWKSCLSFDASKNTKFTTWLYNQAVYQCLNFINKNSKANLVSINDDSENAPVIETGVFDYTPHLKDYLTHILNEMSDKRIAQIYDMRFFSGENPTWSDIASTLNISTQTVVNLYEKSRKVLKKKLTSLTPVDIM